MYYSLYNASDVAVERLQRVSSDSRNERRRLVELLERLSQARESDAKDEKSLFVQLKSWDAAAKNTKERADLSKQTADSLIADLNSKVCYTVERLYNIHMNTCIFLN